MGNTTSKREYLSEFPQNTLIISDSDLDRMFLQSASAELGTGETLKSPMLPIQKTLKLLRSLSSSVPYRPVGKNSFSSPYVKGCWALVESTVVSTISERHPNLKSKHIKEVIASLTIPGSDISSQPCSSSEIFAESLSSTPETPPSSSSSPNTQYISAQQFIALATIIDPWIRFEKKLLYSNPHLLNNDNHCLRL